MVIKVETYRDDGKYLFVTKITLGDELHIKVVNFLNKRKLKKAEFVKTAILREINRILEKEKSDKNNTPMKHEKT